MVAAAVTACPVAAEPADTAATTVASDTAPTLAPPGFLVPDETPPPPALDDVRILTGAVLYQQHCAECHKADLSGEPGWMIPNDDGTYKPPPQDSTGHTWHHADQLLLEIVRDGTVDPIASMPTFGRDPHRSTDPRHPRVPRVAMGRRRTHRPMGDHLAGRTPRGVRKKG